MEITTTIFITQCWSMRIFCPFAHHMKKWILPNQGSLLSLWPWECTQNCLYKCIWAHAIWFELWYSRILLLNTNGMPVIGLRRKTFTYLVEGFFAKTFTSPRKVLREAASIPKQRSCCPSLNSNDQRGSKQIIKFQKQINGSDDKSDDS